MLVREHADAVSRLEVFRREQREDTSIMAGDEMDVARSLNEAETQARLVERARVRMRSIEAAIDRLDAGSYGVCVNCGEEIAIARLMAVPCAEYCIDCQRRAGNQARGGPGAQSIATAGRWTSPLAVDEAAARASALLAGGERLPIHFDSPFGPEPGELDEAGSIRRKRGRPRKIRDASENRPH